MSRIYKALLLGGITALVGVIITLTPLGINLEENYGLDWLFKIRGEHKPPPEVVVVAIDKASTDVMDLPRQLDRWSRAYHAELVNALVELGAEVIAFDILFSESRDHIGDEAFAQALRHADNTVLISKLARQKQGITNELGQNLGELVMEQLTPPLSQFADATKGVAPFILPKVPAQVRQYWTFRQSDTPTPTLPLVVLQLYGLQVYDEWLELIRQIDPNYARQLPEQATEIRSTQQLINLIKQLRQTFSSHSELGKILLGSLASSSLDSKTTRIIKALIKSYEGDTNGYLNFYGGPRTIQTLPYYQIVSTPSNLSSPVDIKGKVVFVGLSEQLIQAQEDGFLTVFSQPDGSDLAGVEIAATAFGNLIDDDLIRPLNSGLYLTLLILWGLMISVICYRFRGLLALSITVLVSVSYFYAAYISFVHSNLWLPIVIPIFFQAPLAFFMGLAWHYRESSHQRQRLQNAFSYYVPTEIVQRYSDESQTISAGGQLVHGTCMFTDAEQYTRLSEALEPQILSTLMNDYYETLFAAVRQRDGIVSDVIGDAMLALWTAEEKNDALSSKACAAALAIVQEIQRNSASNQPHALSTRIGLHHGPILLGNVGAVDHFEYRAVGDVVNTATRIEGLNKLLGTRILATEGVIAHTKNILHRKVGHFILAGKTQHLEIYEVMDDEQSADSRLEKYLTNFDSALDAFYSAQWHEALAQFDALLRQQPLDGPTLYYHELSKAFSLTAPSDWRGVIKLAHK